MKQHAEESQQENAARMPLSPEMISEFQTLWCEVTKQAIDPSMAAEYGRQLLALYKFVYKPLTKEQYEQLMSAKTIKEVTNG